LFHISHRRRRPGDDWPKTPEGESVPPAFLVRVSDVNMESGLYLNLLEAYGIPCVCAYPGDGSFGRVLLGMSGLGTDIYVPETLLGDAQDIISAHIIEDEEEQHGLQ